MAFLKKIADRICAPVISNFLTSFYSSHYRHIDVKENYIIVIRRQRLNLLQYGKSVDCLVNFCKIILQQNRAIIKLEGIIVGDQAAMLL